MICSRFRRLLLAVSVAVFTSFALGGCGGGDEAPETASVKTVKTMTLESPSSNLGREYPGRVQAATSAELAFRVAGPLVELNVVAGQNVTGGEVLARIDPRDFQTHVDNVASSLSEAQAQLAAMHAGARPEDIRILESNVAAAQARFDEAETQLNRAREMVASGILAQSELDVQQRTRDVARAHLDSTIENLNAGKAGARAEDIQAMEARIEGLNAQKREAEAALADTVLKAPFDGVVARTYVENFEDVQAKQAILSLQDDTAIEIVIEIPESAMIQGGRKGTIQEVAENLKVEAEFAALEGQRFPVTLKDYETEADSATQTFKVTFVMTPPEGLNVRPGMNATLRGSGAALASDSRFLIPSSAVYADGSGEPRVWKVNPQTMAVSSVPVELGALTEENVEVLSGLVPGDRIVTSAANSLREGMQIRSMNEDGGA